MTDFITVPTAADARYHLRYRTVSPDFKIEEALRGMRACLANAAEADMLPMQRTDWTNFARGWQALTHTIAAFRRRFGMVQTMTTTEDHQMTPYGTTREDAERIAAILRSERIGKYAHLTPNGYDKIVTGYLVLPFTGTDLFGVIERWTYHDKPELGELGGGFIDIRQFRGKE